MPIALTRAVSPRIAECELTHLERRPIDPGRARHQHEAYEEALRGLGFDVRRLPPEPDHPDGVFVEDAAVVLDELAIATRPGAESRRGEVATVVPALEAFRPVVACPAPATLDGGDVLVTGRAVFVGRSARTSDAARAWLRSVLEPIGYAVRVIEVRGCLHLKSAVTAPAPDTFLLNPEWVSAAEFAAEGRVVEVDPAEPYAANVLGAADAVLCPEGAPATRRRLERLGLDVRVVDVSELARAEAGVTCCSVIVPCPAHRSP